jgi:hypothetical protein
LVAILVNEGRSVRLQADLENAELLKRVQLVGLAEAIVIRVDPHPEARIDGIARIYNPVPITSVPGIIKDRQRQEAIGVIAWGLRCVVAEQLGEIVDSSVVIAIER